MTDQWPPEHCSHVVSFEVSGDPVGAGSKDAIPLGRWRNGDDGKKRFYAILRDDGVPIVNVVDSSDKRGGPQWREAIQTAVREALREAIDLIDGPVAVRVTFFTGGPQSRYGTGRNAGVLKETADRRPHRAALADGTKLARALEDALNGVLWTDDRRVCDLWWSRDFGRGPGARVDVYSSPPRFCDVQEQGQLLDADQFVIMDGNEHYSDDTEAEEAGQHRASAAA